MLYLSLPFIWFKYMMFEYADGCGFRDGCGCRYGCGKRKAEHTERTGVHIDLISLQIFRIKQSL